MASIRALQRILQQQNIRQYFNISGCCCTSPKIRMNKSYSTNSHEEKLDDPILKQMVDQINITGPLTIHQYMRTVLTHPHKGYYMNKDVLGEKGDFTTSPEISQMFGELVGIWVFSEWRKMGQETPLNLVEFGPGRGTLMMDVLRVLKQLGLSGEALHVHLLEVSPYFEDKQKKLLCDDQSNKNTFSNSPISWHKHLETVPKGFSIFLAHEFFDALPIHKLVKVDNEWKEILVDTNTKRKENLKDFKEVLINNSNQINSTANLKKIMIDNNNEMNNIKNVLPNKDNNDISNNNLSQVNDSDDDSSKTDNLPLRYVISRTATPASKLYTKELKKREEVEVSPESQVLLSLVSERIKERGGAMLVIDYGHEGVKGDTFRAYRQHTQQHPLKAPGSADLTADVDFSLLTQNLPDGVNFYGPITQKFFLKNMGIELRLMKLLNNCKDSSRQKFLLSGYKKLIHEMGSAFKVLAIYPAVMKDVLIKYPPPGFHRTLDDGWKDDESEINKMIKEKMGIVVKSDDEESKQ